MTLRLGRTAIRVSASTLPFAAFCIVAGEWKQLLLSLLSLALHEAAHAIAARNAGLPIKRVTLYPFGAVMQLDNVPSGTDPKWTVAAAGPLFSLAVSGMLRLAASAFGASETSDLLLRINLAIAALNLLPAFPLDGGRVLKSCLCAKLNERAARTVTLSLTVLIALGLFGTALFLALRETPAWTLLSVPPFLLAAAFREWRVPDAGTVVRVMDRNSALRRGEPQKAEVTVVPDSLTVTEALTLLSARRYTILRVQGTSGCTDLDEGELIGAAARSDPHDTLKKVISGLTGG